MKKEKREPAKKKAAASVKKASIQKTKKEVKKAAPAMPLRQAGGKQITKPKKISKHDVIKKEVSIKIPKVEVAEAHKHEHKPIPGKKKPPKLVQYHGVGGRKTSVARVWLSSGAGKYLINGRPIEQYANGRKLLCKMAYDPFVSTNTQGKFDVYANVIGGGYASQIGAVRQGLSEALISFNPEYRGVLRKAGFLTRDPREKERKKYGQKRARKRFQYSKR